MPTLFPTIHDLVTHRFRGFSEYENTIAGLTSALDFGVQLLEFDVRASKTGLPVVYHDEYAKDSRGTKQYLHTYPYDDYPSMGGFFSHIPTLEAVLDCAVNHHNQTAKLLIDIKDYGLEETIHALVGMYRLQERVIYVSWLPEVLYALDTISPKTPKCLSHWCKKAGKTIQFKHTVHTSTDGRIPSDITPQPVGTRSGWSVLSPLKGEILDLLKRSQGGICVPARMISRELRDYYHENNLFVSTYSYTTTPQVIAARDKFKIDYYFIDKKVVFDDL